MLQVDLHALIQDRHLRLVYETVAARLEGAAHLLRVGSLVAVEDYRDLRRLGHRLHATADVDRGDPRVDGRSNEDEIQRRATHLHEAARAGLGGDDLISEVAETALDDQPVAGVVIDNEDAVHSNPSGDDSRCGDAGPPATVTRSA